MIQVRRFVVDKAVSASFEYLVGKLGAVFPQLRAGSFSLTWTDGDGDKVCGVVLFLSHFQKFGHLSDG